MVERCDHQRTRGRHVLRRRATRTCKGVPHLGRVSSRITALDTSGIHHLLGNRRGKASSLGTTVRRLSSRQVALLITGNFPKSCLRVPCAYPSYRSANCVNDQGYAYFGGTRVRLLCTRSGLGRVLRGRGFSDFSFSCCSTAVGGRTAKLSTLRATEQTCSATRHFIRGFSRGFRGLFLCNSANIKGAFLSRYVTQRLLESARYILCFSTCSLFSVVTTGSFSQGSANASRRLVCSYSLLVVSSLKARLAGDFMSSRLFLYLGRQVVHEGSAVVSAGLALGGFSSACSREAFSQVTDGCRVVSLVKGSVHVRGVFLKKGWGNANGCGEFFRAPNEGA